MGMYFPRDDRRILPARRLATASDPAGRFEGPVEQSPGPSLFGGPAMWKIIGICLKTGKRVEVATAENDTERRLILQQEARNYRALVSVRVCMAAA